MIEITTLFLALVFGPQLVELDVSPDVAAVEIRLDGASVEVLTGPPWNATIDLGPGLLSHRLEAIALDRTEREIDRATSFINLGHQRQGGTMVLLEGQTGRPEAVSLGWESIGQREAVQIEVFFDGDPVAFEDPKRIPLPDYEVGDFHFVSAIVQFHDGGSSQMELGFGGPLGLELASELTAVAVQSTKGARAPKLKRLESGFRLPGSDEPLTIHGIEKSGPEIILVRDDGVQPIINQLVRRITGGDRPRLSAPLHRSFSEADPIGRASKALEQFAQLPHNTRFRVLAPKATWIQPVGVSANMFQISDPFDGQEHGLLVTTLQNPPQQRDAALGPAVALAGRMAHGTQSPRAVLLILGDAGENLSNISPEAARAYLQDLGVPLYVWGFEPLPQNSGWGEIQSLGSKEDLGDVKSRFSKLTYELGKDLKRQRVVWIKGRYLPREVEIADDAEGLELVGRSY